MLGCVSVCQGTPGCNGSCTATLVGHCVCGTACVCLYWGVCQCAHACAPVLVHAIMCPGPAHGARRTGQTQWVPHQLSHPSPCQAGSPCHVAHVARYPHHKLPSQCPGRPRPLPSTQGHVGWGCQGAQEHSQRDGRAGTGSLAAVRGRRGQWEMMGYKSPCWAPPWQSGSRYICWGFICNAV